VTRTAGPRSVSRRPVEDKTLMEVGVTVRDDPSPTFTVNYMDFVRNLTDET
jgi:hypothetical protein